jgi:hypothetical protein
MHLSVQQVIVIVITVVISATTTFMTVRQSAKRGLMQTNVDPTNPMAQSQKYMMYIVPFFSLTGLYWQFGLVLYWVTTNVWTLGQQYFMFRNWSTDSPAPAGAATVTPVRAAQSSLRPASGAKAGTAKAGSGGAKAAGAPKTASGSARPGTSAGRPVTDAPRAKAGSGAGPASVQTGSARSDAAAASPNGQNDGAKRGLLRLGRAKQEPAPEPEAPAAKVVRQQPVRQAKSKRSGKR